ncbi:hypothetical protein GCM10027093_55680 [Paraburkholderia jirisanensis]
MSGARVGRVAPLPGDAPAAATPAATPAAPAVALVAATVNATDAADATAAAGSVVCTAGACNCCASAVAGWRSHLHIERMACDDRQNVRNTAVYKAFSSMRRLTFGGSSAHSRPNVRETGPSGRVEGSAIAPSINVKGIVVDMSGHPLGQMRGRAGENGMLAGHACRP